MKELEPEITHLEEELDYAMRRKIRLADDSIDWDNDLKTEKEQVMDNAMERTLMDLEVVGYDPVLEEFVDEGFTEEELWENYEFDNEGYRLGIGGQYVNETWDKPLREIQESLNENGGICTPETSQAIEEYISKLESLPINPENETANYWRESAIWSLKQAQANSPDDVPAMPESAYYDEILARKDNAESEWASAEERRDEAKHTMINSKKKVHERNVALYETVNEKQNCADVFEETKGNAFANPNENIDSYIERTDFKQYLNKDGTVNDKAISKMEEDIYNDVVGWEEAEMRDWI